MANAWTVAPILRVADVRAAAEYYRDVLGFELREGSLMEGSEGAIYAVLRREGIEVHLGRSREGWEVNPGVQPNAIGGYFRLPDVRALHEELVGRGSEILQKPTLEPWGDLAIVVRDLDGYVLLFASAAS
jgi:uncharacterized glyoxalase superfamily protein PhnB